MSAGRTSRLFLCTSRQGEPLTVRRYSRIFYEKRMAQEVAVDSLGDEFKGYVVRITGGNDVRAIPLDWMK